MLGAGGAQTCATWLFYLQELVNSMRIISAYYWLKPIKHLLCARHCSQCLVCVN